MGERGECFADDFVGDFRGEEGEDVDLFSLVSDSVFFLGEDLVKRPISVVLSYSRAMAPGRCEKVKAKVFRPRHVSSQDHFSRTRQHPRSLGGKGRSFDSSLLHFINSLNLQLLPETVGAEKGNGGDGSYSSSKRLACTPALLGKAAFSASRSFECHFVDVLW